MLLYCYCCVSCQQNLMTLTKHKQTSHKVFIFNVKFNRFCFLKIVATFLSTKKGYFVYYSLGCTYAYHPLSYPFRFLIILNMTSTLLSPVLASHKPLFVIFSLSPFFSVATLKFKHDFPVWLRNRLISAGLETVFSHTEKSCIVSYFPNNFP